MAGTVSALGQESAPEQITCDDAVSRDFVVTSDELRTGQRSLNIEVVQTFGRVAASCPQDQFALHYASWVLWAWADQIGKAGAEATPIVASWERAFAFNLAYWALPEQDRSGTITIQRGISVMDFFIPAPEVSEMRKTLIRGILDFDVAGRTHPWLTSDTELDHCPDEATYDLSAISAWTREREIVSDAAYNVTDRLAQACWVHGDSLGKRAAAISNGIFLRRAKNVMNEDPIQARSIVSRLRRFRNSIAISEPDRLSRYWSTSDRYSLSEIVSGLPKRVAPSEPGIYPEFNSMGIVVRGDWFDPSIEDEAAIRESIAWTLDAAWADGGMVYMSKVMLALNADAQASPDPEFARRRLHSSVAAWAEGCCRGATTKDASFAPEMYSWINPN